VRWPVPEGLLVRAVLALALVGAVYFLVTGAVDALRAYEVHRQEERLRAEVERLKERYRLLEALHRYMESDEFVEMMARRYLGLVREGEVGIVVISPSPTPTPQATSGPWWEAILP